MPVTIKPGTYVSRRAKENNPKLQKVLGEMTGKVNADLRRVRKERIGAERTIDRIRTKIQGCEYFVSDVSPEQQAALSAEIREKACRMADRRERERKEATRMVLYELRPYYPIKRY